MKIEKRPSGSYRVRQQVDGKRYCFTFDHKPTQKEVSLKIAQALQENNVVKDSFEYCAKKYIENRSSVISPSTIKGYTSMLKNAIPEDFKKKKIADITQDDIQVAINDYAIEHTPKSVRNVHGFISAVIKSKRPNMVISTTLPAKLDTDRKPPTLEDIYKVIDISSPQFTIALKLAMLGMRRSEICAATIDDIEGNVLHITKALVYNTDNEWITKATKTAAGTRDIYLPNELVNDIIEQGYIYKGFPNSIYDALQNYCAKLKIKPFRFHDLRHFYASYAHSKGMTDADIMASGGWKSDYTMKSIYRHEMEKQKEEMQKVIADNLIFNEKSGTENGINSEE